MKIVVAAWHLKDFNVGLGRYTRGLIEAIGRVDKADKADKADKIELALVVLPTEKVYSVEWDFL